MDKHKEAGKITAATIILTSSASSARTDGNCSTNTPGALRAYQIFAGQTDGLLAILVFQYDCYEAGAGKVFWVRDRNGVEVPVISARLQACPVVRREAARQHPRHGPRRALLADRHEP